MYISIQVIFHIYIISGTLNKKAKSRMNNSQKESSNIFTLNLFCRNELWIENYTTKVWTDRQRRCLFNELWIEIILLKYGPVARQRKCTCPFNE